MKIPAFLIFWIGLVSAEAVTLYMNDTRITTKAVGGHEFVCNYNAPNCGHAGSVCCGGTLMTLNFVGNAISVYFLYASDSGLVTITLDGQTFPTLDTYRSVDFLTCQLEVWSQDNLTPTAHTLTLTGHQTPANLSADADYLQLHKIVYSTPDVSSSTAPSGTTPSSSISTGTSESSNNSPTQLSKDSKTALIAGIVGAVAGVLLLMNLCFIFLWWRRRRQRSRQPASLDTTEDSDGMKDAGQADAPPTLLSTSQDGALREPNRTPFKPYIVAATAQPPQNDNATPQQGPNPHLHSPTPVFVNNEKTPYPTQSHSPAPSTMTSTSPIFLTSTDSVAGSSSPRSDTSLVGQTGGKRLSTAQLQLVQTLANRSVPQDTIADVITTMLAEEPPLSQATGRPLPAAPEAGFGSGDNLVLDRERSPPPNYHSRSK